MVDITYGEFITTFKLVTHEPIKTNKLDDRIIAQKVAFLLYKKGLHPVYTDFIWYLHGVFSWGLWHNLLTNVSETEEQLTAISKDAIIKFRGECIKSGLSEYFNNSNKMELITTILYTAKSQNDIREDNEHIIKHVKALKDKFSDEEISEAIRRVKQINWKFT